MSSRPLYWDSSYDIVLTLIEVYPNVDLESVSLDELNQWILNLPNFADDPMLVNNAMLQSILREWYEETNA